MMYTTNMEWILLPPRVRTVSIKRLRLGVIKLRAYICSAISQEWNSIFPNIHFHSLTYGNINSRSNIARWMNGTCRDNDRHTFLASLPICLVDGILMIPIECILNFRESFWSISWKFYATRWNIKIIYFAFQRKVRAPFIKRTVYDGGSNVLKVYGIEY